MHLQTKAFEVIMTVLGCMLPFLMGGEKEDAIINVKCWVLSKGLLMHDGVLGDEGALFVLGFFDVVWEIAEL